jgi:IS30 family transposase
VLAYQRASRPKPAKLVSNPVLRERVQTELTKRYSPEQIAGRLREDYPEQPEMWVSTETIYQSLYVQSRGALRRELTRALRTGRAMRIPNRQGTRRKNRVLPDMVNISARPAEVADRAVPGHWEGDLIIGKGNASAVGTLVERSTGYTMLVPLSHGFQSRAGRTRTRREDQDTAGATAPLADLGPGRRDAGLETVQIATDIAIYFCDPHSPWQRATNENTNGLLRQYFPKGTDLSVHTEQHLDAAADELNDRPRKRLQFKKPIELIGPLLLR